jgi:glycosyltransferase involved in cell wall biosynthesis
MKIAFLNDGIYDHAFQSERGTWATGGAERQQWWLARAMASAGWTVSVGVRRPVGPRERMRDGVGFVELGPDHILRAWYQFFRSERPEWWFWQCASHLFGFGVALAHLNGVRTIFGAGVDRDVRVREALYHRHRWWPAYAFGLSRTDRIVLQHRGQQSELPRRWRHKSYIVPNIIAPGEARIVRERRQPTVSWVAALRVAKRPDRLVEIARRLPHIRFVACGSPSTYMTPPGYSERAIEAFRSMPNIDYRGQVSPAEADRIISDSSILLSTSDEEGFPQTFLEAWSRGTPVVTLGIDPDGAIQEASLGAVCATTDAAAHEIDVLIGDTQRWDRQSANARSYVVQRHSPEAAIQAIERAVKGVDADTGAGVGAHASQVAISPE